MKNGTRTIFHIKNGEKKPNTLEYICKAEIVQIVISEKYFSYSIYISTALHRDQSNNATIAITTKVVSLNPAHDEVYSIPHYVIKFVSNY